MLLSPPPAPPNPLQHADPVGKDRPRLLQHAARREHLEKEATATSETQRGRKTQIPASQKDVRHPLRRNSSGVSRCGSCSAHSLGKGCAERTPPAWAGRWQLSLTRSPLSGWRLTIAFSLLLPTSQPNFLGLRGVSSTTDVCSHV